MPQPTHRLVALLAVVALLGLAAATQAQEAPDLTGAGPAEPQGTVLDPGKPSRVEPIDFPEADDSAPGQGNPASSEEPSTYNPTGGLAARTPPPATVKPASTQARSGKPEKQPAKSGLGEKIVKQANRLVGKSFNYAPGTKGGVLGCANVVSSILRAAGVVKNIMLSCRQVIADLLRRGWEQVKPPPYKDGDVITWATYDYTGDGRIDPDTHIGIIDKQGGTTYAINNSSSRRRPVKVELGAMNYRISRVLRKKD